MFKGFWDLWTENRGAPKTPNSATTDLTPHVRPSDNVGIEILGIETFRSSFRYRDLL